MMTKEVILIVDDDPSIREGLSKAVTEEFGSHAAVLTCENGMTASQTLKDNTVDLVITDIKMPYMSGIDLLKFIKTENLHCKTIVLSGYDDYNLVRDALKLGAEDYLLKPVDFGLLINTIRNLLALLQLEKQTAPDPKETSFHSQILLEYFLHGENSELEEIGDFKEKYKISDNTSCSIGYVNIQNIPHEQRLKIHDGLVTSLYEYLSRVSFPFSVILTGEIKSYWIFLILGDSSMNKYNLLGFTQELNGQSLQVSCSPECFSLSCIDKVQQICLKNFERFYFDLPYHRVPGNKVQQSASELISNAAAAVSDYNYARAMEALSGVFALLNLTQPPVQEIKQSLTSMIYDIISKNPRFIPPISSSKFTEYDIFDQIETSSSLSVLQKQLFLSLNYYIEQVLKTLTDKDERIVQQAKDYIKSNYNDNISLDDIAAHVFLHSNYFSALFKNKTGITYRQYLRSFRIEKAKQMMMDTEMKIYEIAQEVGYNDSAHFVRAFKEVTGVSPSNFRLSK